MGCSEVCKGVNPQRPRSSRFLFASSGRLRDSNVWKDGKAFVFQMRRCTRQNIASDICFTGNRSSAVPAKGNLLPSLASGFAQVHPSMRYSYSLDAVLIANVALEYSRDTEPKNTIHGTYGIPPNF
jgi:hypothetical protein